MKKKLVVLTLGLVAAVGSVVSSQAQGYMLLDNYASSGPRVGYGSGYADSTFTVGLYYAAGDVTGSIPSDPSHNAVPGGPLTVGTGSGSTVQIYSNPSLSGYFSATSAFSPAGSAAGGVYTFELAVYNGSDYASSLVRGHSDPFAITLASATAPPPAVGTFEPAGGFSVSAVPEPATMAFVGMGVAAMLINRRRK